MKKSTLIINHQPQGHLFMKNRTLTALAVILLFFGIGLKAQTTFQMPSVNCTDVALLQQMLPLAPGIDAKVRIGYLLVFAESPPVTFQEAAEVIANVTASVVPGDPGSAHVFYTKQYAFFVKKWLDDLAVFCQAHPTAYDINIALRGKREGKAWALEMLADRLRNHNLQSQQVPKAINGLVEYSLAGEIANEEVKDILQKLNLRYTNQLITDKEQWAPVVAQIRTLLEQY